MISIDPRTRLIVAPIAIAATLPLHPAKAPRAALLLMLGLACWFLLDSIPLGKFFRRGLLLASPFVGFFILVPFSPADDMVNTLGRIALYCFRGWLISMTFVVIGHQTCVFRILSCLSNWGVPRFLVVFIAIQARQLESLKDEAKRIVRTMGVRGGDGSGSLSGRVRQIRILALRLVPGAMLRADRTAEALMLRGWQGQLLHPGPWQPRMRELAILSTGLFFVGSMVLRWGSW